MAIEKRGNATYFYRSRRAGKKVTRKYVASGDDACLAASVDEHRRLRKQIERQVLKANRDVWDAASAPLEELIAVTELLATASLLYEGFHRHHQGEWRRRREKR